MKKFTCLILTILVAVASVLFSCASNKIAVYSPDGAPALALAKVIKSDFENTSVNIVSANKIASCVTGKEKKADICILPINLASKLIYSGEDYKMLGTVTHGNFYFLSTQDILVDSQNLGVLVGKTVGVMQLQNVPGLTFKSVLSANEIDYITIEDTSQKQANKVNLMAINKVETARSDIDLFLIPSPLADAKVQTTSLKFVGSLGEIYGEGGFPQAIIVAKNTLLENNLNFVKEFISQIDSVESYLKVENKVEICALLHAKLESGLTPTFNENNLTADSIARSQIKFIPCKTSKSSVVSFILNLKEIQPSAVNEFSENFFYTGEL